MNPTKSKKEFKISQKNIGPSATYAAKQALRLWVPKIERPEDFDFFSIEMKKKFWLWKLFYDIEISIENTDIFKLHLSNCPFCEVLNTFGLSNLSSYICEGDWAIANDNKEKWLFERTHQIGTGDTFCDHTYKRIKRAQPINKHCPRA